MLFYPPYPLIPAQAGIQMAAPRLRQIFSWVPAFAGTSGE